MRKVWSSVAWVLLAVGGLIMTIPFLWMASTSLKTAGAVFVFPPQWIPHPPQWSNYREVTTIMPFARFYLNSAVVAVAITALQLATCSLAAFAFARLRFPGRDKLFLVYLATLMVPYQVILIPDFLVVRSFHWIDTFSALIIPFATSAFGTFLLRQFFLTIPTDLEDAARIDGCGPLMIFRHVVLPLSGPALATLAIFTFLGSWNNFLWPLIVTNHTPMNTLPVGLTSLQGEYVTQWHLLMVGSVIALLPILLVFVIGQRYFVKGITLSGFGGR